MSDGVGPSIPEWALCFFQSFAWTRARLLAMLESLPDEDDWAASPEQFRCPRFLRMSTISDQCGSAEVPCPEHSFLEPEPTVVHATRAARVKKPTKYGRCSLCEAPRKPWIYKTGPRAGQAFWVCSQLFSKGSRKCFKSVAMTEAEVAAQPHYFRKVYSSLTMRLMRGGRGS